MQHRDSLQLSPFLEVLEVKTVPDRSLVLPGDPGWSQDALEEPPETPCGAPWETKGRPRRPQGSQNDAKAAPRAGFYSILGWKIVRKRIFLQIFHQKSRFRLARTFETDSRTILDGFFTEFATEIDWRIGREFRKSFRRNSHRSTKRVRAHLRKTYVLHW